VGFCETTWGGADEGKWGSEYVVSISFLPVIGLALESTDGRYRNRSMKMP